MNKVNTETRANSALRGRVILLVKLSAVGLLLYFLASKGFLSLKATQQAFTRLDRILPAIGALIVATVLGIIRWQLLLRAQNIRLSWKQVAELTLIGNFFNIALPGAVSGDFVKAFYIGKEVPSAKSRAFGSILFDRVVGLSALVFISASALLLGFRSFLHSPLLKAIQIFMIMAASAVAIFYSYLFLVKEKHDPLLYFFHQIEKSFPRFAVFSRIYESLRHYHHHRMTIVYVLGLSISIHLMFGWMCYQFALAIQPGPLSLLSVYIIVPLGLLITAVPIGPAGIGTGNVAFLYFFSLLNYPRGADVYSMYAVVSISMAAVGGLVYFRYKSQGATAGFRAVPLETG